MPPLRLSNKATPEGIAHLHARLAAAALAVEAVGRWSAGGPPSPLIAGGGDRFLRLARSIREQCFALEAAMVAAGGPALRADPANPRAWLDALDEVEVVR